MEENIQKAQVGPTNELYLLRGVPLDPTYENTLFFDNVGQQENYFKSKVKYIADNISGMQGNSYWNRLTYVRRSQNTVRIEVNSDKVIDCNYIMFKNTNFTNKWFYGFITETRYINDVTTEIVWELDVMQTWFFDFYLEDSFVERGHGASDPLMTYNHTPEPVSLGEYRTYAKLETTFSNNYKIVIVSTVDSELENAEGTMYTKVYSGIIYLLFDTPEQANAHIMKAVEAGKQDSIISVFMAPKRFYENITDLGKVTIDFPNENYRWKTYGSYVPKNNKLFQYPYCYLRVSNNGSDSKNLMYEMFDSASQTYPKLEFSCAVTPTPTVICLPMKYAGEIVSSENKVTVSGFPQCAFATDQYKAFLAQRNSSLFFDIGAGIISGGASGAATGALFGSALPGVGTAVGGMTGGMIGAIGGAGSSLLNNLRGILSQDLQKSIEPSRAGAVPSGDTDYARGLTDFSVTARGIAIPQARIIDDFFTMFGYAVNRVTKPHINIRPHWTYVKTQGCNIVGSVPGPDAAKIKSIFDNGITHWRNPSEVGDYSLNNRPVSRETAEALHLETDGVEYMSEEEFNEIEKIRAISEREANNE